MMQFLTTRTGRATDLPRVSNPYQNQELRNGTHDPALPTQTIFSAPYAAWTPAEILAYYQQRDHVHYFPVRDAEQASIEKISGILHNEFEFNGERYQLSPGFNWATNPSRDKEWLILLHKFYYAVGLGEGYAQFGDPAYLAQWVELTSRWIDTVPLDFLSSDVMGRRVQNWIFAHYYWVTQTQAAGLTPDFYHKFLTSIHDQVNHLCTHLTPARNHRTIELYAIFLAAVVFPEMREAARWLDFARQELLANIQADLLPDGVQCELSTDYHHLVLKNYLNIIKLARLNQIAMPAEMDEGLQKALEFAKYIHKPDGAIPSLSDGDARSFWDVLKLGYELYGDKELLYVLTQGKHGQRPGQRSKVFADSGYAILRSGWGEQGTAYQDEHFLVFDCGPLGAGNHGHLDLLNLELAAYGQSLVVDPGRYTYNEPPEGSAETNWRVLFRGTSYHNTVQVDGKEQTHYVFHKTRYRIRGPAPDHELKQFSSTPSYDFVHGIARSHEYPVIHERKICFVWPEYWIVTDVLHAAEEHSYDLRFHLADTAYGKTSLTTAQGTRLVHAPHLVLAQPCDPQVTLLLDEGFVSRSYGQKEPAPVVRFQCQGVNVVFHTILFPFASERPQVRVQTIPVQSAAELCAPTQAFALQIEGQQLGRTWRDHYFWADPTGDQTYQFADFRRDAGVALIRQELAG